MKRRHILKMVAAVSLAAGLATGGTAFAADPLKIGAVAPKTGPLAGGAAVTHWPNIQLWAAQINERGGLNVDGVHGPVVAHLYVGNEAELVFRLTGHSPNSQIFRCRPLVTRTPDGGIGVVHHRNSGAVGDGALPGTTATVAARL